MLTHGSLGPFGRIPLICCIYEQVIKTHLYFTPHELIVLMMNGEVRSFVFRESIRGTWHCKSYGTLDETEDGAQIHVIALANAMFKFRYIHTCEYLNRVVIGLVRSVLCVRCHGENKYHQ